MSGPSPARGVPSTSSTLEHSSTVDRVADELRRAVFDGELGAGTPLREVALAESLGVSRSTVREALAVLVAEGLATREPHRGVYVTSSTRSRSTTSAVAREVLEMAGVRRWADGRRGGPRRRTPGPRRVHRGGEQRVVPAELTAAHLAIHRSLVGLTESPRLVGDGGGAVRRGPAGARPGRPDPPQRRRAGDSHRGTC